VPGGAVRIAIGALLALSPVLTALGLLALAEWRDRRRAAAIAWQVRLTDAISAELGRNHLIWSSGMSGKPAYWP
jgi:hypothetical protein